MQASGQRMMAPCRREGGGSAQLDPIWRQARELGVENEYGSMLNRTWDAGPIPSMREGTWAQTSDHYFRNHSSRELQVSWKRSPEHDLDLGLSPEPSRRDIRNCLMDTPDCSCRWILLDTFQNPAGSGRLSYDPREGDLAALASSHRPPGYVCSGRDPRRHIRIRSAALQGFVTPSNGSSCQGSTRTSFVPEVQGPRPWLGLETGLGQSGMMTEDDCFGGEGDGGGEMGFESPGPDDDGGGYEADVDIGGSPEGGGGGGEEDDDEEFDDVSGAMEFLSGQSFEPREGNAQEAAAAEMDGSAEQAPAEMNWNPEPEPAPAALQEGAPAEIDWNSEPEPPSEVAEEVDWTAEPEAPAANEHTEDQQVQNVGRVVEIDPAEIDLQLRRPRPGQNRVPDVDPVEAWRNIWMKIQRPVEYDDSWEALIKAYYGGLGAPESQTQAQDEHMRDVTAPELVDYEDEVGAPVMNWAPRSGDVIILKSCRHQIPWPGFDGKVEIFVDEKEHTRSRTHPRPWPCRFEDGDVIVRFGSYQAKWQWTQAPQVRVYQYREEKFFLVARQTKHPLYPLEYKFVDPKEKILHHLDFRFRPRWGDLIVNRGIQYPFVWYVYWWDEGMPVRPSDLLVRAAFDEDDNLSYCDAELYLLNPNPDFPDTWIFLGKDEYCFAKTDQFVFHQ